MKRIMILLLIACSATITASAQQKKATVDNTPYNVKALFYTFLKSWGAPSDEVYSVVKNPNTNQIESSVKITYFVANVNTGTVRQNMSAIAEAFKKDEPRSYQLLHLAPTNKESFSLSAVNENGQRTSYLIRAKEPEEMWLLCAKNPENPKLRDAYAIKWTYNNDKSKALGAIYQITSLRPDYYEQSMSGGIFNSGQDLTTKTFRIDGRVGEDLTDSLYVVYMADSAEELNDVADDAFVAKMPVVGKRFSFSVELDKRKVGRIRTVMPDGSLCQLWTNLDFVPGETYRITTHNGYYDADNDYEQRVGRYSGKSLLNDLQRRGIDDQTVEVVDTIPGYVDGDIILNGVEFKEAENQWGMQAIPVTRGQEPANMEAWTKTITPQQQALLMFKAQSIKAGIERVKASYEPLGRIMRDTPSVLLDNNKGINQMFENITAQNKELDKNVQEFQKALFALNPPAQIRQSFYADAYKEILNTFTEQNKGFTELFAKTGSLPKAAQKTQKYINKLTEKYVNEMIKGMQ